MLRRERGSDFDRCPVVCSDGERAGTVLRVHGVVDGWPQHVVIAHRPVETERVRMRKRIVEREVMVPVTLRHEELEVVRPVVERETVPVERVRLVKRYVRDEITVDGEVRREEVAVDRLPPAPATP